jgi:hypothetical protein
MNQKIKATFPRDTFVPHQPCELPEGAHVDLWVNGPTALLPEISDPQGRAGSWLSWWKRSGSIHWLLMRLG